MSLRVWLPLNEDLTQQGASGVAFTNNNATVNASGKIGKCYAFSGSSQYLHANYNFYNPQYSVCAWVYSTSASTTQTIVCDRTSVGNGFSTFLIGGKLRIDPGGEAIMWTTNYIYPTNTWFHLSITYDGTKVSYYINGEFQQEYTCALAENYWGTITSIGASQSSGSSYNNYLRGKLNDVRIYDHCLSTAEVREISQGLVLHYKLNGFMGGTNNNLAQGSKLLTTTSSITNCNISKRGSPTIETRTDGFAQVKGTAAWQGFSLWSNSLNLTVGSTYTYSFYGYTALSASTNAGISFYPMMYNSAGTRDTSSTLPISVMGGTFTNSNAKQIGKLNTTPQLYWATFTWNQTMANIITNGGKIELSIQIHGTFDTGRIDYLWAPKLELGDKPTTWTPSIEEMGIDPTKIEDSSGYNHNGTITGTLSNVTDTPRYAVATTSSAAATVINTTSTIPTTLTTLRQYSLSIWVKTNATNNRYIYSMGTGTGTTRGFWLTTNGSKPHFAYNGSGAFTATTVVNDNIWHHVIFTVDDVTSKCYVDGVLCGSSTNTKTTIAGNDEIKLVFNGSDSCSDFRIYCTALSADDILALYHTSAKVDNKQNFHTFELVENNSGIKINKCGQTLCNELEEDTATKFYKTNQIIETNEIIEL